MASSSLLNRLGWVLRCLTALGSHAYLQGNPSCPEIRYLFPDSESFLDGIERIAVACFGETPGRFAAIEEGVICLKPR